MRTLKKLFDSNKEWAEQKILKDANFFKNLAQDQDPDYLWIGCSDSRVPANEIINLGPGQVFVHRNVANVFPHTDFNCLSVLEFAVHILKVKHVIVCGHYGCGGVKAAMHDHQLGLVDNWLRHIRDVYNQSCKELENITDQKLRFNKLVELNVAQQVHNVCRTTIVQQAWANHQPLNIHGWVYDLESGLLKDLDLCYSNSDQLEAIYRIQTNKI
jgi:carbonic anhydrase